MGVDPGTSDLGVWIARWGRLILVSANSDTVTLTDGDVVVRCARAGEAVADIASQLPDTEFVLVVIERPRGLRGNAQPLEGAYQAVLHAIGDQLDDRGIPCLIMAVSNSVRFSSHGINRGDDEALRLKMDVFDRMTEHEIDAKALALAGYDRFSSMKWRDNSSEISADYYRNEAALKVVLCPDEDDG
jgi:hypothetical protein